MSNGEELSGFDAPPEISEEEALQEQVDRELERLATAAVAIMDDLQGAARAEVDRLSNQAAEIQGALTLPAAQQVVELAAMREAVEADALAAARAELDRLNAEAFALQEAIVVAQVEPDGSDVGIAPQPAPGPPREQPAGFPLVLPAEIDPADLQPIPQGMCVQLPEFDGRAWRCRTGQTFISADLTDPRVIASHLVINNGIARTEFGVEEILICEYVPCQDLPGPAREAAEEFAGQVPGVPPSIAEQFVVALNCERRILEVVRVDEFDRRPALQFVARGDDASRFDIAELLERCDAAQRAEEEEEQAAEEERPARRLFVPPPGEGMRILSCVPLPGEELLSGDLDGILSGIFGETRTGAALVEHGVNVLTNFFGVGSESLIKQGTELTISVIRKAFETFLPATGCFSADQATSMTIRAIVSFLDHWTGGAFREIDTALNQIVASACPTQLPTAEQALSAWLADQIPFDQLQCYVEANNFRFSDWVGVANAAIQRPSMLEGISAWRRGVWNDEQLRINSRQRGWVNEWNVDFYKRITEALPFQSDLVRFMVRDTADPEIVREFDLMAEFDDKFQGEIRNWARALGIPDSVMQHNWMAHWRIPGASQLADMLHRLARRPDGSIRPQLSGNDKKSGFTAEEIEKGQVRLGLQEIQLALAQDDIPPFWRDRLLAISFRLPRIAQLRAAFRTGEISETELRHQFVKRGLETSIVNGLTKHEVQQKNRAWGNNPLTTAFSRGELTEAELRNELQLRGADVDAQDFAVRFGLLRMQMNTRKRCLAAIRHKVLIGQVNRAQARNEARQFNPDPTAVNALVDGWFCERDSRSKPSTAAELCSLFKDQIIDSGELTQGLLAINIDPLRVARIVQRCQLQLAREIRREEEREVKRLLAEARRQAAEREKAAKASEAQRKAAQRASQKAEEARNRREAVIGRAARTLSDRQEAVDFEEALAFMLGAWRRVVRNNLADAEEAAKWALLAAQSKDVAGLESWTMAWERALNLVTPA